MGLRFSKAIFGEIMFYFRLGTLLGDLLLSENLGVLLRSLQSNSLRRFTCAD